MARSVEKRCSVTVTLERAAYVSAIVLSDPAATLQKASRGAPAGRPFPTVTLERQCCHLPLSRAEERCHFGKLFPGSDNP